MRPHRWQPFGTLSNPVCEMLLHPLHFLITHYGHNSFNQYIDICHLIWRWRWSLPQLIVIKIEWAEHRHTSLSTAMVSRCRTTHHSVHDGHHTNMCMIRHGLHHTSCSKGTARLKLSRACKVFVRSSCCQSIKRNKRRHRSYLAVTSPPPPYSVIKDCGSNKLFKVAVADPIKA